MDGGAEEVGLGALSQDAVASIQARLPLVSLLRSQLVCKAWKKTVASASMLKERLEARGGERERVLCVVGFCDSGSDFVCGVYDPASNRWYKRQLDQPWILDFPAGDGIVNPQLRIAKGSADGGMLLYLEYSQPVGRRFFIPYMCNPVARSWSRLPALPGDLEMQHVMGVWVDATARCFKLVALHDRRRSLTPGQVLLTFVFDSRVGSWTVTTWRFPTTSSLASYSGQGVFVGTTLYCVASPQLLGDGYHTLLAYDMDRAKWSWLAVAKVHDFRIYNMKLFTIRDRLLCVAIGECLELEDPCVQILELDFGRMTWTPVGVMPASMFTHFRDERFLEDTAGHNIFRVSHGIRDMEVARQGLEVCIMDKKLEKIVAFDLEQTPATWRWLRLPNPSCPNKPLDRKSLSFHCLDPWLEFGS